MTWQWERMQNWCWEDRVEARRKVDSVRAEVLGRYKGWFWDVVKSEMDCYGPNSYYFNHGWNH